MVLDDERGDLERLSEIIGVFVKYEFGPLVDGAVEKHKIAGLLKKAGFYGKSKSLDMSKPVRLRKTFEELGPIFIKFGQTLSTREDILPKEYVEELSNLQDKAPPLKWDIVELELEKELGKPYAKVFKSVRKAPLASASLGQVHRAVLKGGEKVVFKIQRPGIEKVMKQDIRLMKHMVKFMLINDPDLKSYNLPGLIEEFERGLEREIDYRFEGRYADKFKKNFKSESTVKVPEVYWKYSTENLLVMEYVDGVKVKELFHNKGEERNEEVARRIIDSYLKQVFEDRFFHGDPHPSNILVLKDDVICYLDFGLMKHLSREFSYNLSEILIYMMNGESRSLIESLQVGEILPEDVDKEKLARELEDLHILYYQTGKADLSGGLEKVLELFRKHKMRLPQEYALLIRSFIEMEGLSRQLAPKMDMVEHVHSYFTGLRGLAAIGKKELENMRISIVDILRTVGRLPRSLRKFAAALEKGSLSIEFKHLDELIRELDRVSNRIAASILLAALIMGSALIIHAGAIGPEYLNLPLIGAFGFLVSMLLGLIMVMRIVRKSGL